MNTESQSSVPDTIFISHASKDWKYAKELVNLLSTLKIPNIICSSLNGYHIPNDNDIYDYLAQNLNRKGRVVFLLSKHYYESAACLNEMGACWILKKNYTTILTPNFDFKEITGAVNPNQMSFRINDENRIVEFIEGLMSEFNTTGLPTMEFVELVKITNQSINQIAYDEKVKDKNANYTIESCRNLKGKLEVALRIINPTEDRIRVDSIICNFKDDEQHTLFSEVTGLDFLLHKYENRIFYFELDYGDSDYNLYRSVSQDIEIRTYIDAFRG